MSKAGEDTLLVKRFLDGDESAFNLLLGKYRERIYWHARRMTGNHFDADEILQQVYLVLYEKLSSFKFESALYTWIYKITATRSLNLIRKRKAKSLVSIEDNAFNAGKDEHILKNIEDREKLEKLDRILQQLPEKQREVFALRHFDGLSYDEISEITGTTTGALKANFFHAMKKVTQLMEQEDEY